MSWSAQQEAALKSIAAWLRDPGGKQVFRMFGYAGTGKTTIAKEVAQMPKTGGVAGVTLFAAFTGKAALMMRRKGCEGASTIHSLIYKPPEKAADEMVFELDQNSALARANVVVIDECSMVDEELGMDLRYFGKKILVIGDPAQLPPVGGAGYFTNTTEPNVMLTEIHRQALDSPIIAMATRVRQGQVLPLGDYGTSRVMERSDLSQKRVMAADQVLVGMNKTRLEINAKMRTIKLAREHPPVEPLPGERLVCLRNQRKKGLLNGGIWTVDTIDPPKLKRGRKRPEVGVTRMTLSSEDFAGKKVEVGVPVEFWTGDERALSDKQRRAHSEFYFGYALTTHKSQGSQWDNVLVFDESRVFREDQHRWLYTAITRAAETVTLVRT